MKSRSDSLIHMPSSASSLTKSDKPDIAEIEKFGKSKWKRTEMQKKIPLPSKEMSHILPICTVHSTSVAFLFYFSPWLCKLQRGWIKFKCPFQRTLTMKFAPASPVCLSGWQGMKSTWILVKEEAKWDNSEI